MSNAMHAMEIRFNIYIYIKQLITRLQKNNIIGH
ncbi:hypothetical protein Bresa_00488|uniref:Uncharacterized protein n=1 Tax=Brenneria salicis ATCC 15712 = DSM 30166 TaxID=714314 RepID=A0A366I294_9GAMM|nr:hypothetical protein [Brenneria salicis ATCC 15712 = DSM 30166]RBP60135.1 hypothetical protein DES54_1332 [Brenneria salicis ATCC 15712 = DSM 30166]